MNTTENEPLKFSERACAFFKETRKNEGLTAREFAQRIGCTFQNLSLIENKKSVPSVGLIEKVESEFGVYMTERTRWP